MDDLPERYSEMGGLPIDHSDTPIRLFKSDFLEFFTHISPIAVIVIWLPIAALLIFQAIRSNHEAGFPAYIPLGVLTGLFLWTFYEYMLHRFIFHYHAKTPRMKRIIFLFHGIHHAQPQCKTRLVMPPAVSAPLAFVFYGVYYVILVILLGRLQWVDPLAAGTILGYLAYDLIHYATHHFPMRQGISKFLKRYHMQHHFKTPSQRFGVSSPLWDVIFKTYPQQAA